MVRKVKIGIIQSQISDNTQSNIILAIKSIKCTDSKFDDNPEVKAYIQVRDLTKKDRNNVFVFNGWMFSSSPSIAPFDHPVYDIWLVNCY